MKQPIANIVLKLDKNGSSVQCKHVTPAEVMFLCAMHHVNAGGDPIVKLQEIEEDAFAAELARHQTALEKLQSDYDKVLEDPYLLENIRESRLDSIGKRLEVKRSVVEGIQQIENIRELSPGDEFRRLSFRYNNLKLREFFPGRIPTFPSTFEEARNQGTQTTIESEKWLVGGEKLSRANG